MNATAPEVMTRPSASAAPSPSAADTGRYFYTAMSLVVAGVIFLGFGHDADARLFHRTTPCPPIVYVHASVCSAFVILFVAQCALVRASDVAAHRRLGVFCVALGAAIPFLGIATAVAAVLYDSQPLAMLAPQFQDLAAFSIAFALAVLWRRQAQYHRRLMLLALCCLSAGAFGRLPTEMLPPTFLSFYAGVDLLILAGVIRDLVVLRRVHPVYAVGLPAAVLGQALALRFLHLG